MRRWVERHGAAPWPGLQRLNDGQVVGRVTRGRSVGPSAPDERESGTGFPGSNQRWLRRPGRWSTAATTRPFVQSSMTMSLLLAPRNPGVRAAGRRPCRSPRRARWASARRRRGLAVSMTATLFLSSMFTKSGPPNGRPRQIQVSRRAGSWPVTLPLAASRTVEDAPRPLNVYTSFCFGS